MKVVDFVILGIIFLILIFALRKMIKNKKSGKCNCGCCNGSCRECSKEN